MKKKLFILSLLFTAFFSYQMRSQQTIVKWGSVLEKEESRSVITKVIGVDDQYMYFLREIPPRLQGSPAPNKFMLEKCNKTTMEKVFCKELIMREIYGKRVQFQIVMMIDKKMVLFTSVFNKINKKHHLFMEHINSAGELDPEPKEVYKTDWSADELKAYRDPFFIFSISNDGKKILVTHDFCNPTALYHSGLSKEFIEKNVSYKIIDNELNILSSKTIKLPPQKEDFVIIDYKLNSDGSLYMLAKFFRRKIEKSERLRPASKYGVFYYTDEKDEVKDYDFIFDDKYLTDVTCLIDKNDNLICAGFYATQTDYNVMGTFCIKIDKKTKKVTAKEFQDFDLAFSDDCLGEERLSALFMSFNYNLKIILKEDGGFILVGEAGNVSDKIQVYGNGDGVYVYRYKDLIAVNVKPDGSIIWHKKIAKNQTTVNDGAYNSSYFMGILKNKLYLVFNDNKKNLNPDSKKAKEMDNAEKSIPVIVGVDLDQAGALTKKQLFNTEDSKNILCPRINFRVSDHELIILKAKGSSYNFGKISF